MDNQEFLKQTDLNRQVRSKSVDQLRQEALQEFFLSKSPEAIALEAEFQVCLDNARSNFESETCGNREWAGGKVEAYKELLDMVEAFKNVRS